MTVKRMIHKFAKEQKIMEDIKLSKLEKIRIYRDVIYGVLFEKQKRNKRFVETVYENGVYRHLKEIKLWNLSLDDVLRIDFSNVDEQDKKIIYEKNYELVRNYRNSIWEKWQDEFYRKISRFIEPDDHIVELGCGYGRNLFVLRKFGIKNKMSGFDISNNAISVAKEINKKFDLGIDFGVFDYTKKIETDLEAKTVFTYATLEQVKYGLKNAIENIINAKPKQVIHFETIPELLDNNFYKIMIKLNRHRKDYQTDLLDIIQKNNVKISHLEENEICTGILNPIMMVRYTI